MSRDFINGQLAEKAKMAYQLIAEVLSEIPDDLLHDHQENLSRGVKSLLEVHHTLRSRDSK